MSLESLTISQIEAVMDIIIAPGSECELVEKEVGGRQSKMFANTPPNLAALYLAALLHGDKTFIVDGEQRYSFAEVHQASVQLANAMVAKLGIKKGDRIAICMRNTPEWCFAFLAATRIGAVAVPLNSWWRGDELRYALQDSGTTVLFADERRLSYIADELRQLSITGVLVGEGGYSESVIKYQDLIEGVSSQLTAVDVGHEDLATILYTSGSTGAPKGVYSNQFQLLSVLMGWAVLGKAAMAAAGITPEEIAVAEQQAIILTVPLFHVTGCYAIFLSSILTGRKVVFMHKWDAEEALKLIERERITHFNGVPTMSMELFLSPNLDKYDLSSLQDIQAGGAARPPKHVDMLQEKFPGVPSSTGYGLTETNAAGCLNGASEYRSKPTSVGKPIAPLVEVRIVGEDGADVPVGMGGEIWFKSPSVACGYWNNPEATAESFIDGWFKTGDQGRLDEEGFVYITGRIKEIIIRGGENIGCNEIESAIFQHPNVRETAVFGLPDERLGEIVAAVVLPKAGTLSQEEIQDFLRDKLAGFKIPSVVVVSDQLLPRIATGKIDKIHLREAVING